MKLQLKNKSTHIDEMHHDPETNELRVQFSDGSRYRYSDVPAGMSPAVSESPARNFWLLR